MDLAQALIQRLGDDASIGSLIGERYFWVSRPQAPPNNKLPALVMQVISEDRPQHLDGFDDMRTARVQLSALAMKYGEGRQVLEAAIAALVPAATVAEIHFWRAGVDGPRDTSEEVAGVGMVHRPIVDLLIRYAIQS